MSPNSSITEGGLRIGSVCSGYRGLDMAVENVFGGTTAWVSDIDPGANRILAHHWPDVPNLGDLKTVDWSAVEPVDIFCGGYPCQPFSTAGQRKGTDDERHIWPWIASALGVLRPRLAIFENVGGHLRLGFDTVLADLAALGFDAEWCVVRASEVGAPHQRRRLIILAVASDAADLGHERAGAARGRGHGPADHGDAASHAERDGRQGQRGNAGPHPERQTTPAVGRRPSRSDNAAAADTGRSGREGHGELPAGRDALRRGVRADTPRRGTAPAAEPTCPTCLCPVSDHAEDGLCNGCLHCTDPDLGQPGVCPDDCPYCTDGSASDAAGVRRGEGRPESARLEGRPDAVLGSRPAATDTDRIGRGPGQPDLRAGQPDAAWGRFAPAIARWENATGRRAPWATDDRNRLSPAFVEWLMGLPAGHVTEVPGLTRNQQLHALGNGVVPHQAEAALRLLAARAGLTQQLIAS